MNDNGSAKPKVAREIIGITLAVASIFVLISLFTFNPADRPDPSRIPANPVAENSCGTAGAHISYYLFRYVGVLPSFSLAVLVGIWGGLSIARVKLDKLWYKVVGAGVFVIAFATIEKMALPESAFAGRFTGGYFGTFLGREFTHYLGSTGAFVVVLGVLGVSLLLATELMFYDIIRQIVAKSRTPCSRGREKEEKEGEEERQEEKAQSREREEEGRERGGTGASGARSRQGRILAAIPRPPRRAGGKLRGICKRHSRPGQYYQKDA
jgi:S-DNA-T family DNA segregation ATPase FtsK/SpoIIIE